MKSRLSKCFVVGLMVLLYSQLSGKSPVHPQPAVKFRIGLDANGKPINAHGAGVLYYKGTYYLYGEIKKGKTTLVPKQQWEDYRVPAGGVSCYSSKDLVHWIYRGIALAPVHDHSSDLDTGRVIERPKVIYNDRTGKFVMWMHVDKKDYSYSQAGVAISHTPIGPFRYLGSIKPNKQMVRDLALYKDDDGKAYLIYTSEDNKTMQVCQLGSDYLTPTDKFQRILIDQSREGPAVFKYKNKYYLISSATTGWSPNAASYAVADNLFGPWKIIGNPCKGKGAQLTFGAQSAFVLPVQGQDGQFIFMADRWNKTNLAKSSYLWLPIKISNEKLEIRNR